MFHVKHEAWTRLLRSLGIEPSPSQTAALRTYEELLRTLAIPRGFIARSDEYRLWTRHIADGLRAAGEIPTGAAVLDLGSGAGIPGVPLAVVLPASGVTLAELRRGRVAFLEAVVDRIGLSNAEIHLGKAETVGRHFDVCVARAFSSPVGTWTAAEPLLGPAGSLVYWAGQSFDPEGLDQLGVSWRLSTRSDLADAGPLVIMGRQ
jgi:16S rRNA (guanine527-N7)-methyltransferase